MHARDFADFASGTRVAFRQDMKTALVVVPAIVAGAWLAADTVNAIVRASLPSANPPRAIEQSAPQPRSTDSPIRFAGFGDASDEVLLSGAACPASVQVLSALRAEDWPDATMAAVRVKDVIGVVQRGDVLADWPVDRVTVDEGGSAEVVLRVGGDLVACRSIVRGSSAVASAAAVTVGVTCASGSVCTIPRPLVEAIANGERTDAWSGVRVVPYFEGGKPLGFKLYGIKPETEVAKLGLKNGDVVKSVNGIELQSPGSVFGAYGRLRHESEFTVALLREGREETLRVDVR